jgi:transposase
LGCAANSVVDSGDDGREAMPRRAEIVLSEEEREVLERWARRPKSAQALALRCRIVLAAAEGEQSRDIAARLGCNKSTVGKWRGRFAQRGLDGLHDEPRPGKPRSIGDDDIERVIVKTLEEQPPNATHWSTRSMAAATGMSQTAISRIWRAFGLKPHQTEAFKLSPDPQFIDKVRDIVGLYLDPPEAALLLCVDEKSQIQALDRTQPGLPMKKGRLGTLTHDYKRHGTTTLFAALNVLDGTVIAQNMQRHRHQEFIRFLNRIEREVPAGKAIHVILDNYAAHKKDKVRAWLKRHSRWTFHFTPTSCSWLNAVEGFFAKLTRRRLKHGVFHSVVDLQAAINRFVREYNAVSPKPFVWKANPDDIIAARNRGFQTLESIH